MLKCERVCRKIEEMGYIWQELKENNAGGICESIKDRCSDTGRQNLFANMRDKT